MPVGVDLASRSSRLRQRIRREGLPKSWYVHRLGRCEAVFLTGNHRANVFRRRYLVNRELVFGSLEDDVSSEKLPADAIRTQQSICLRVETQISGLEHSHERQGTAHVSYAYI